MKKAQISPSFPLESQASPMFFKLFKAPKCALDVCSFVFFPPATKCPKFSFYMLRILAKTRSSDVLSPIARQLACHWRDSRDHMASQMLSPVARQLACHWRDSRDYMPLACQLALWIASGSPVGAPLACSFPKIENWLFLAPFSFLL